MKLSKENQIALSDITNTIKHTLYVIVSSVLIALLSGLQNGTVIDWEAIKVGAVIAVLNAALVLVNRYLKDNTGGNVGSDGRG